MEQRQHQGQAALLWQAGLDIAATIRVSGGGRKMFLDIPFYRTGVPTCFAQNGNCCFRTVESWEIATKGSGIEPLPSVYLVPWFSD
jgi:hypothetical protein